MKRRKLLFVMIAMILALVGCALILQVDVYDDEEALARTSNTYRIIGQSVRIVNQNCVGSMQRFEGMNTLWTSTVSNDGSIDITYKLSVSGGKLKLVLITPDDAVTTLVEITPDTTMEDYETISVEVKKGENRIKLVGSGAEKLNFDITIPIGEFHTS